MLCADISHKIMRTDTVLDFFYEIRHERNFTERAIKALVGEIVLTRYNAIYMYNASHVLIYFRYNNRTYRIDDINWDMNPRSTFENSAGEKISFMEYYAKVNDYLTSNNFIDAYNCDYIYKFLAH